MVGFLGRWLQGVCEGLWSSQEAAADTEPGRCTDDRSMLDHPLMMPAEYGIWFDLVPLTRFERQDRIDGGDVGD